MRLDHQRELAKRFVMVDERLLQTHPDSFRLLARGASSSRQLASATSARSTSQLMYRPSSAAELRPPALTTSEHVFGSVGLRGVEPMSRMRGRDDNTLAEGGLPSHRSPASQLASPMLGASPSPSLTPGLLSPRSSFSRTGPSPAAERHAERHAAASYASTSPFASTPALRPGSVERAAASVTPNRIDSVHASMPVASMPVASAAGYAGGYAGGGAPPSVHPLT